MHTELSARVFGEEAAAARSSGTSAVALPLMHADVLQRLSRQHRLAKHRRQAQAVCAALEPTGGRGAPNAECQQLLSNWRGTV
jgi:hypothetical protein